MFMKHLEIFVRAGIRHIKPHDFRHTWITNRLKEMPEALVKKQAGLTKSSRMLEVYSHLTDDDVISFLDGQQPKKENISYQKWQQQKERHHLKLVNLKS